MNSPRRLRIIREQLTADEAIGVVAAAGQGAVSSAAEPLYYPYHYFRAGGSAPGLFGRRRLGVNCLVDARSGVAVSADPFVVTERPAGRVTTLPTAVPMPEAERAATRCLSHGLGRHFRMIADFRLELVYRGVVYKPYWLVGCGGETVLVDGANGAWHLVRAA